MGFVPSGGSMLCSPPGYSLPAGLFLMLPVWPLRFLGMFLDKSSVSFMISPNACLGSNVEGKRGEGKAPKLPVMVLCFTNKIAWGSLAASAGCVLIWGCGLELRSRKVSGVLLG